MFVTTRRIEIVELDFFFLGGNRYVNDGLAVANVVGFAGHARLQVIIRCVQDFGSRARWQTKAHSH